MSARTEFDRDYFRRVWEWSAPGAHFALQTILRNRAPRILADIRDVGWVSHALFPGGITLSQAQHAEIMRRDLPRVRSSCVDYRDYTPPVVFDTVMSICRGSIPKCSASPRPVAPSTPREWASSTISQAP